MSELGIVGFLLFSLGVITQLKRLSQARRMVSDRAKPMTNSIASVLWFFTSTLVIAFGAVSSIEEIVFLAIGTVVAQISCIRSQRHSNLFMQTMTASPFNSAVAFSRLASGGDSGGDKV